MDFFSWDGTFCHVCIFNIFFTETCSLQCLKIIIFNINNYWIWYLNINVEEGFGSIKEEKDKQAY